MLAIVTATLDPFRAFDCLQSWVQHATDPLRVYAIVQDQRNKDWEVTQFEGVRVHARHTREVQGVVPAFAMGIHQALYDGAAIIACLHDDLLIEEDGWDQTVTRLFKACPRAGLCGFGGAKGLGSDDLYQVPYHPMQLARQRFMSNMRDAEAHGVRATLAEPVACLDGFSQIGLAEFWRGRPHPQVQGGQPIDASDIFTLMQSWGVVHHFYDGMLGCFAKRLGWQTWFLPVRCHHYGGRTAVADSRYQDWATARVAGELARTEATCGDQVFWQEAHRIGYNEFRDVLPIRV